MTRMQRWAGRELWLWLATAMPALAATSLSTVLLRRGDANLPGLAGLAAAVLICGIGWSRLAPPCLQRIPMLAVLNLLALALGGLAAPDTASAFTGFFLVTFCFVGLSRPPGTSLLLVPLALPGWLLDSTSVTSTTLAKAPVAVGCWILVGELIASYRAKQQKVQADLEHQLERDSLTGLKSRRNLDDRLAALSVGDTVVFLDLDHFKAINDMHGHAAGDQVLVQFAGAVLTVTRPLHEAIRYGGEEILVLMRKADPDQAEKMLTQLRAVWRTVRPEVTFSAGISAVAEPGGNDALRRADEAMYQAKRDGRNRWHIGRTASDLGSVDAADETLGQQGVFIPLPRPARRGARQS